jgi:hypothetical protein
MVNEECVLHGNRLAVMESMIKEIKDDYLVEIKAQVQKTNGRVTAVEKTTIANQMWISFLWLALGAIATLVSAVILQHISFKS